MELLAICFIAVLVVPLVLLTTGVLRVALGLLFLLFMPGYTFMALMLPRKASIGSVQRLALSVGLSIAIVALTGFVVSYTPWGITISTVTPSIALVTIIASAFALYRRRRLPEHDRFGIRLRFDLHQWKEGSSLDKALSIALVLSAVAAVGLFAYSFAVPKEGERYTEFFVLGREGLAGDYELKAAEGEEVQVTLGVVNHEHQDASYRIEVRLNDEKVEEVGPINLTHLGRWEGEVAFRALISGEDQKVDFQLYRDNESEPYRELHLWIDVEEAE